jgi:hypothetical protein
MARQRNKIPAYQRHSSGRARVRTYDADGNRIEMILPGEYGSEQSKREYARILTQVVSNGSLLHNSPVHEITIAELALKFMAHASAYYIDPVTKAPTNEVVAIMAHRGRAIPPGQGSSANWSGAKHD